MAQKPSIPKGTRDFSPLEMAGRDYIFNTVRTVFKKYGYSPIETPAMENLSTLLGKYGEEGDKLLFKVLNSGDAFAGISPEMLQNSNSLSVKVCEKGLRYDLTVPFARFVVQHQNELVFPFKRYQIQPVWRADRPQKGRYREFYQCDVDVVGSDSLINELELVQIVDEVFSHLGLSVAVKINNRKVLSGIAEVTGHADKLIDITVAIDKIDKIGIDAVKDELRSKGIDDKAIAIIEPILSLSGTTKEKLSEIRAILSKSETGNKGVDELEELFNLIESAGVTCNTELDLSLARGLNYYTGAIFEVKSLETAMGSICGGGRYDDLTGIFGLKGVSGVGISFGADRIYDVISALDRFPKDAVEGTKVLFTNMGKRELLYTIPIVKQLREAGVPAEIYTDEVKLKKQFDYAEKKGIPFLAIIGEDEVTNSKISLKNLSTGEQKVVDKQDVVRCFKN
ncbi:Histidine--tRNA ligase [bioreactor metagenome]|jgi:histidyl-tRNA synthetase|uniref:histidine--tRNA ligase n=1 Tax=bioreactor metagenome TaxID=1076179 RepID=A0A644VDD0_9ZZZZ|nr:histidine--tRNA ligase [Bacteroidales bacterium]MBP9584324.1 histidine--tRNA ligase [Bacteroidales bacterium]MBP9978577.1 histidine--tRNA ligase [Bacteroidales bacterium]